MNTFNMKTVGLLVSVVAAVSFALPASAAGMHGSRGSHATNTSTVSASSGYGTPVNATSTSSASGTQAAAGGSAGGLAVSYRSGGHHSFTSIQGAAGMVTSSASVGP